MDVMDKIIKYFKYVSKDNMYYEKQPEVTQDKYIVKELNDKWKIVDNDSIWTYYHIPNVLLPMQGWKIHISATLDEAEQVLECVSNILISLDIPFKHIKSRQVLLDMYSKNGNRTNSGKFITIYPQGEEFLDLLETLEKKLLGFRKGPYILTDKQWKNTNIFFRYGAFKKMLSPAGELCLIDANGNLVPDLRKPQYYVPDFVKVPKRLNEADIIPDVEGNKENKLKQYRIDKALRFTNSGGIYIGERVIDGTKCVIKEARAEIGLDGKNHTAEQRLENEYVSLSKLNNVTGVVNVIEYFKVWDNAFLVEEFVEGIELSQWIAGNYPFSTGENIQGYFNKIVKIMDQLKDTIRLIHQAGVAMCDLQTKNILVDDKLNVTIIDFEIATDPDSEEPVGMATKGFFHILNKKASEKDWYSLNRILQFALLPIGPVTDIHMDLNAVHCSWIKRNFGEIAYDYFLKYQLDCCKQLSNENEIFKNTYNINYKINNSYFGANNSNNISCISNGLLKGLLENCQVECESLINGDIRQFELNCGKLNLLNGGFGAILSLFRCNALTDDIKIWIDNNLDNLFISDYNDGFLSGRTGIALTLYECGYIEQSLKLVELIMRDYSLETFDLTLRSGLSGIGLMFVALYSETKKSQYIYEAEKIAKDMMDKIASNYQLITTDWDSVEVGLIDGYSGMALFYTLLFKVSGKETYLQFAQKLILKDVENSVISNLDGSMQTFDENKKRFLPY